MATLGDLKARIVLETNRSDIDTGGEAEDALTNAITRAVEFHSDERFWFNRGSATVSASTQTVAIPTLRVVDQVAIGTCVLRKFPLDELIYRTDTGQPTAWAENGDSVTLWPIPDSTYSLQVYGIAQIDAPTLDADDTVWTNEAYDLIAARTRFLLFRDAWRDNDGAQGAAQAEDEALTKLRRETRRRGVTPLRSTGDEPWSGCTTFNINRG